VPRFDPAANRATRPLQLTRFFHAPSAFLELYDGHAGARHLDVGVGTGYFLDRTPGASLVSARSSSRSENSNVGESPLAVINEHPALWSAPRNLACRLGDKSETASAALNGSGRRKTASRSADEQHR
jgi:hypothetical protein